jgi:hypothetical protein
MTPKIRAPKSDAIAKNYHIMVLCILLVAAVFVRDGHAPGVIACAFLFFSLTAVKVRDFLARKRQSGR